jgi:hypothetical protein
MVINPLPLTATTQTWQALLAKPTAQIAQLRSLQFAIKVESFSPEQRQLFEEALAEELASLTSQLNKVLSTKQSIVKYRSKHQPRPAHLPQNMIHHKLNACMCSPCRSELRFTKDEISEHLEYMPAR